MGADGGTAASAPINRRLRAWLRHQVVAENGRFRVRERTVLRYYVAA